jgi:magnesium and cobalt transporter
MSGSGRPGLAARLRGLLGWRQPEHSVRDHIAELVQEAADAPQTPGVMEELDRHERALIANILRLRGTTADDVMVPRADIVAIAADLKLDQALQLIRTEGHSRLPVYGEQLDDILGMVHIKDVFAHSGGAETFSLRAILRRPLMVAPQISVLDLLLQMRQARMHLALVVDEYGGIDGLVTIEDLVETIVGDIADEHDEIEGPMLTERPDGTLDVNARMSVEDFEQRMGHVLTVSEREADIETVGGLVFTLAGRVPARGEVLSHPSGIEFRVLESDPRNIRRLRVRPPAKEGADKGGADKAGADRGGADKAGADRGGADKAGRLGRAAPAKP